MATTTCSNHFFAPKISLNRDSLIDEKVDATVNLAVTASGKYFPIHEVRFGESVYPFVNVVYGYYTILAGTDPLLRVCVADTFLPITGQGKTLEDARQDWGYEFHRVFQKLSAKLHWEQTKEEKELWRIFEDVVDIPAHRRKTPINYRQTGKIIENINIPRYKREIEWLDGSVDIVDCNDCPLELLQYKAGEYFRADLLREYQTGKLVKIRSIGLTCYRDYTDEEVEYFINSLQSSQSLPDSIIWK
jgi:hypothetical protein